MSCGSNGDFCRSQRLSHFCRINSRFILIYIVIQRHVAIACSSILFHIFLISLINRTIYHERIAFDFIHRFNSTMGAFITYPISEPADIAMELTWVLVPPVWFVGMGNCTITRRYYPKDWRRENIDEYSCN